MAVDRVSTRISAGFVTTSDTLIENGQPIIVDSIVICNQDGFTGRWFKLTDTQNTTILDLYLPAGTTVVHSSSFIADRGLVVKPTNFMVSYTIFYKGSG